MLIGVSSILILCLLINVSVAQPPEATLVPLVLSPGSMRWLRGLFTVPQDGNFRPLRREIRLLTDQERRHCFEIIIRLKRDTNGGTVFPSKYDVLAHLHESTLARGAHGGPAFFGWHRLFTIMFENAMREIDSNVTIPYWDMMLDQPVGRDSIIFSSQFFGNGNGPVVTGPFANWRTPTGIVRRAYGNEGSLMSRLDLRNVLRQSTLAAISFPTAAPQNNLEEMHNNVHLWIGGDMRRTETSTRDPIFFFLHSYFDCVWERFRDGQKMRRVNPSTDYPLVNFGRMTHGPNVRLGLGLFLNRNRARPFLNRDGVSDDIAHRYFMCEGFPVCSRGSTCGSPHLRCVNNRCISVTRRRTPLSPFAGGFFPGAGNPMRDVWRGPRSFRSFTQPPSLNRF